jgi:Domain of unknown function (DUF4331)
MKRLRYYGAIAALLAAANSFASSHREAPAITESPKVDGTDFYMFRSYEPGREAFVTILANYQPLQDAYGGPNYFSMDPEALYEIHIDNNGDAKEDLTFQFKFNNNLADIALDIGPAGATRKVSIPLINAGAITALNKSAQNVQENYTVKLIRGPRRKSSGKSVTNVTNGSRIFDKPIDNIGQKSIADYAAYASSFSHNITIPGCATPGRMFVGQRKEGFVVNLGETFDLINLNPVGASNAEENTIGDKNVTTLALELPISCVVRNSSSPVIGAWTTSSLPTRRVFKSRPAFNGNESVSRSDFTQVSRLANPLVNEVVIGLKDKNRFNNSEPVRDAQFATYVTHPTLPALIQVLFGSAGVQAPNLFPRSDLVSIFLTGVDGLNKPAVVTPSEMMRLNTSIAATALAGQNNLGVLGSDLAGYPNGRRPGDDVVDISLRAVMGILLTDAQAPSRSLPYTDGATVSAADFDAAFPYLKTPIAGSPNATS